MKNKEEYRPRLTKEEMELIQNRRKQTVRNVLVIGDLHEPFCLDEYFDFCVETRDKYNCTDVVFIGDVIDNHYSSFHEADPDGKSAGDELDLTVERLRRWHREFPNAYVTIGNHDRIMMRKAFSAGLSKRWIRDFNDVLETPTWKFVSEIEIDDVLYVHGEGGTAKTRVKSEMQSIVQGHLHTQAYLEWTVGARHRAFAMQVGCGIDRESYAMAYAKTSKKPIIGCGVVLDNGKTPINLIMDL
jgi:metallophosphoesterase superfamily enzyme